jgi:flagellar basal-body rod protein FlgB
MQKNKQTRRFQMQLFPQSFQSLEQALSTATLKQRVHSSNIANVDTANYKSKKVDFKSVLDAATSNKALASYRTDPRHVAFSNDGRTDPRVTVNNSTTYKANGNNVDMDVEMAELAKNQLWYNAVTERMNGKFNSMRSVINEGR